MAQEHDASMTCLGLSSRMRSSRHSSQTVVRRSLRGTNPLPSTRKGSLFDTATSQPVVPTSSFV
jgi:hypothetical protein